MKKKLLVFASGSAEGGGSGFENLVRASRTGTLDAEIVAVISNYANGGVKNRAEKLGVPFLYMGKPWTRERYALFADQVQPDFIALSGWLRLIEGFDPRTTFNIHPGPLPRFGGGKMYGHFVHEAVMEAYHRGEVTHSAVTMHFVTPQYDEGPVFFSHPVPILPDDTPETLGARVNAEEHKWQPVITNKVLRGEIGWDGRDPATLFGADIRTA